MTAGIVLTPALRLLLVYCYKTNISDMRSVTKKEIELASGLVCSPQLLERIHTSKVKLLLDKHEAPNGFGLEACASNRNCIARAGEDPLNSNGRAYMQIAYVRNCYKAVQE
jgi:hypothetical protein